jgi:hypothetical protein
MIAKEGLNFEGIIWGSIGEVNENVLGGWGKIAEYAYYWSFKITTED